MGFLMVFALVVECTVLFFLEKRAWKTIYTPLNFLMLPYLAVLFVSVAVAGHFGFVDFFYPSIIIWMAGLFLFAIPDFAIATYVGDRFVQSVPENRMTDDHMPRMFTYIGIALVLLFAYRLKTTLGSSQFIIGSDEFAEDFAGFGFWGHLKRFGVVMLMFYIYYVDRNRKWLWIFIVVLCGVNVINMVKGTMIIPCVVGVMMRLASGKMKITARFVTILLICSVAVFFLVFLLAILVVNKMEVTGKIMGWIFERYAHYFTSGTLGLSVDMQLGFPDSGDFQTIWTPFINIVNQLNGSGEILSPVNPLFHFTGISLTNVRTLFGTLFIYTNYVQFCLYTMGLSAFCYFMKVVSMKFRNVYTDTVYFYFCGLLAMGWFEFYFFHLDVIEIPAMIVILHLADWIFLGRKFSDPLLETA